MKCPKCGTDNVPGSNFCADCGTSIDSSSYAGSQVGESPARVTSFPNAIASGFQRYFDFRGRSTRAEYWWWTLFILGVGLIVNVIPLVGEFAVIFQLLTLIPSLALAARRLHDINMSGWWLLILLGFFLFFIPIIILMLLFIKHGHYGPNRHGPDPRLLTHE
jgi:uncharacterized membrane protein YhaH (DUF805 family)